MADYTASTAYPADPAINRSRLFLASCFALITTAFSFSIRAGILPQLATEFGLTAEQLGFINSMWFFWFPDFDDHRRAGLP